ncbi:MAG TPA: hypothetical protein VMZ03_12110 [Chitinophagaceae bacterium]|nr:hypothetical protein [Chitinophagaceae bacterium]
MKNVFSFLFVGSFALHSSAQKGYYAIPIRNVVEIQWSAEANKVLNLTPKNSVYSLKKWYLEKLKKGTVTAYETSDGNNRITSYELSLPKLEKQDWLKGLSVTPSPTQHPQEWYFVDDTKTGYESMKYRGGVLKFSADPCCGCDEADAFRSKQLLSYKNGKFSIYNIYISPLCARPTNAPPFEWYPLCDVAYNDNRERKFPGLSKDVVLLNSNEIDYDFENPSVFDSVLTANRTDIGSLIYQDILKGNLKPVEAESGKVIPVKTLLTRGLPADTVGVYDIDDPSKIVEYRVVQSERSSREFNRIRIKQDLYFDFKHERL